MFASLPMMRLAVSNSSSRFEGSDMRSPVEENQEAITLLGTVAARWATLDVILVRLLAEAVGGDPMSEAIYFSSSSQKLRFDMLRAVVKAHHLWSGDEKAMLRRALEGLAGLWLARNDLMHNHVVKVGRRGLPPSFVAMKATPANAKPLKEITFSVSALQDHLDKLTEHAGPIWDFVYRDSIAALDRWNTRQSST